MTYSSGVVYGISNRHGSKSNYSAACSGDNWIAVRSGQGPGKTTVAFIIATWKCIQYENSQTILTAPTMRQCRDGFLAEGRRLWALADGIIKRLVQITQTKLTIANNPDWGIKTVTATDEKNAQGMHEKHQSIIGDEASGISRPIIEQFKGTSSNADAFFMLIGNPNLRDCAFFDCFYGEQAKYWTKIHWNAEETPAKICDPSRNARIANEFGRDSDVYRVRVQGEFPKQDPNAVMSTEILLPWTDKKWLIPASLQRYNGILAKQFGLDFSRMGGDESTAFRRHGNAIPQWKFWTHTEPADVVDEVFRWQRECSWKDSECMYVPDASGMGQGVLAQFYRVGKNVFEFHNGGTAYESNKYANKITEAYFNLAAKLKEESPIYIPYDQQLFKQLTTRVYLIDKKGKIILEDKETYKKRGHESPDRADGLVQAMYDHSLIRGQITDARTSDQIVGQIARHR